MKYFKILISPFLFILFGFNIALGQTKDSLGIKDSLEKDSEIQYDIKKDYEIDSPAIGRSKFCRGKNDQACLMKYLYFKIKEHFYYPVYAEMAGIEGKVYIEFIIDKEASIQEVHVAKSSGSVLLDYEAVKMIRKLPQLESAAMLNGEPVATSYTIPISFKTSKEVEIERLTLGGGISSPVWSLDGFDGKYDLTCFANEIYTYVLLNYKYPPMAKFQNVQGRVYVEYTISTTGEIINVKVVKSSRFKILDDAAVSLIESIPKMAKPAMKDGEPVEVKFTYPLAYRLY